MLGEIFYWLFNMSIVASLSGMVVLLLRLIKSIPRRVIKILWIIPLIRMWIPVGIGGKYGLITWLSKIATKTVTVYLPMLQNNNISMMNCIGAAQSYFPISYKINLLEDVFRIASFAWIILFSAILLLISALYILTISETKDALPTSERNVYLSGKLTSPTVYGIRKPKILLPKGYTEMEDDALKYVLSHEKAHIQNGDNFWRMLAFVTAAFHWFNPFAWIFLRCFLADTELACDEKVLSRGKADDRGKYASVLVDCAANRNVFVSAFGGAKLRTRVERVLSFRKMSIASGILFGALIIILAYTLLTNAI